jgi:predicted dehydrogenase
LNKSISVYRQTTGEYLNQNHRGIKYRQEGVVEWIHVPIFEPLFLELQHFVDCILEGKPCLVPARDGLKALRLAAMIRNALSGHLIDVTRPQQPTQVRMVDSSWAPIPG